MSKTQIGNYKLGKLLGYGNFAIVRHGINIITNHEVAVKIINKKKLKKLKMIEPLQREIVFSRLFNHPHVIKMYEYLSSQDGIYVISEFASKGELFEYVCNEGYLSENKARELFQQIIYALEYIHSFGVSHRDLKLENILLDDKLNIKLGDFGLCNKMRDGRALFTSCGTPNYAAPEVMLGKSYDGKQIDIWSCGVILYAMLHGELPFDNENISELSQTILNGKYKMKKTVSEEAKDLINRMLQPNPLIRITISEILAHPWFSIDVPKYLRNFYEIPSNLQNVDSELIKNIIEYYDDLSVEEIQKIEEDIENGESNKFCVHYSFLSRAKMMSAISDLKMEGQSKLCFSKRKISKRKRQNIKSTHQVLEGLSKRINSSESKKNELKALKTDGLERTNSILSNSTITSKTDEDSITKNSSNIGLVYKGKLEDLFRVIFTQLKRMNIVWKSLGSGYVFKCKNEDAQSESIRNEIRKEELLQYMKSDKFKFYLQIDRLQQTKNSEDESPISCSEYLVSFIWINGAIQNFLDFMNIFKSSIEELL